jgi:hypothetical protein
MGKSACSAVHFPSCVNHFSPFHAGIEIYSNLIKYLFHAYGVHGGREMQTEFWSENLKVRDHLEDLGVDGRLALKWILNFMLGIKPRFGDGRL